MSLHTPELWYIQQLKLLNLLPKPTLDALMERARLERWGHTASIDQPRTLDQVSLLLEGQLKISQHSSGARKTPILLSRGDLYGPLIELDPVTTAPAMSVRAVDPVTIATLPRELFEELVFDHIKQVSFPLQRLPRPRRARAAIDLPFPLLLYTAPVVRLARSLIYLADQIGVARDSGSEILLPMQVKAPSLARFLGLSARSIELPLRYLLQNEYILIPEQKKTIIVPSLEPLERIALGLTNV